MCICESNFISSEYNLFFDIKSEKMSDEIHFGIITVNGFSVVSAQNNSKE